MRRDEIVLSIVVPVLNEAECLPALHRRLIAVLDAHGAGEIVYIDDRSTDESFAMTKSFALHDPRVRAVRLVKNVGSQLAILCGLSLSIGDVVVSLDADLQHPPELVPAMIERWRGGDDLVHMVRRGREHDSRVRNLVTAAFYWTFNHVSRVRIPPNSADFRLMDRACVDALCEMAKSRSVFLRALVHEMAFRQSIFEYDAAPRLAGTSRYTLAKLLVIAIEAFASYAPPSRPVTSRIDRAPLFEIAEVFGGGARGVPAPLFVRRTTAS